MKKKYVMPKVGDIVEINITPTRIRRRLETGKHKIIVTELSSMKDFFFGYQLIQDKNFGEEILFSKQEIVIPKKVK
jgi:hypothetical protein